MMNNHQDIKTSKEDSKQEAFASNTSNLQFPWKLHVMLKDAEISKLDSVVSWLPDGVRQNLSCSLFFK
jgi:hypothetical protein